MGDPERIFHLGPSGAGYAVKLLLNLLWFMHAAATAEALTRRRPRRASTSTRLHTALVGSPANSVFLERDVRMVLDGGDYDEAFPMRLVTKDLGLAVDLARDVGVPVELTALVEQIHRRARAPTATTPARSARSGCTRTPPGSSCGHARRRAERRRRLPGRRPKSASVTAVRLAVNQPGGALAKSCHCACLQNPSQAWQSA